MGSTRVERKQATRERVLSAARDLFEEQGYEDATVRMIALRAGVAVGSVFTTFSSKAEILSQVMAERLDGLYAELEAVLPHLRGSTADRLRSIMAIHYNFEMKRPRLFAAFVASSFLTSAPGVTPFGQNVRLTGMLRDILRQGVASGELRADADTHSLVEVLVSTYGFNYRKAIQQGLDAEALTNMMDRQIGVMIDGVKA